MSTRLHSHDSFFKYTSLATAKHVIASKSFRWSSPTLFNDPFEHQAGFVLNDNRAAFAEAFFRSSERLIFGDAEPRPNPDSALLGAALQLRRIRDRLPKEKVLSDLRRGSSEVALRFHEGIDNLNATIRAHLRRSRILCVSEAPDNVVMWSHYADQHSGVVFELACLDELDNRLLAARKVEYTDQFLSFPSSEDYARHLSGEQPFDLLPLVWKLAFTKHTDWAYEREWRVHLPFADASSSEGFTLFGEPEPVFKAIYLGCRVPDDAEQEIHTLVDEHLPAMQVLRAKMSKTAFSLRFGRDAE